MSPGGQAREAPAVVYVDAEAAPQILNDRATAWRIDRIHLFPMLATPGEVLDLNASACRQRLTAMVAALRPALVIVDSLGAENQVSAVEGLFRYLNDLAAKYQAALLLIHHLRKRGALSQGSPQGEAVRGSGHIVSLARSVLGLVTTQDLAAVQLGLDPDRNASRRLRLLKTNLGPLPDPLGSSFEPSETGGVDLDYRPAAEPVRHPRTQAQSCARWLLGVLIASGHPVSPGSLEWRPHEAGCSRATLFCARDLLGTRIVDTRAHRVPGNRWALPEWVPPAPPAPPTDSPSSSRARRKK